MPSIKDPKKYFQSNVVGTENIASLAIKYKVKRSFIQHLHHAMEFQTNTQPQRQRA